MWVVLTSLQQFDLGDGLRVYHPGAWVNINKRIALDLISQGAAKTTPEAHDLAAGESLGAPTGSGVVLTQESADWRAGAEGAGLACAVSGDGAEFEYALIVTPSGVQKWELWSRGFALLRRFEAAAPIIGLDAMAIDEQPPDEAEYTRQVVHDLRVPLYDPGLLYVRKCQASLDLLTLVNAEQGTNARLNFLRGLYRAKPLFLALPPVWRPAPEGRAVA